MPRDDGFYYSVWAWVMRLFGTRIVFIWLAWIPKRHRRIHRLDNCLYIGRLGIAVFKKPPV